MSRVHVSKTGIVTIVLAYDFDNILMGKGWVEWDGHVVRRPFLSAEDGSALPEGMYNLVAVRQEIAIINDWVN